MLPVFLALMSGLILGRVFRNQSNWIQTAEKLSMYVIFILLLGLGVALAIHPKLMSEFPIFGFHAFVITAGSVLGSLLAVKFIQRCFWNER